MPVPRSERARRVAALLVATCLGVLGCGGGGDDPSAGMDSRRDQDQLWMPVLQDLEEALFAAHLTQDGVWLVVGGTAARGLIFTLDIEAWAWRELLLPDGTPRLRAVWGSAEAGTFVVGDGATILRRDDIAWARQTIDLPPDTAFQGVWGSGPDDVWAVGEVMSGVDSAGVIVHWDGLAWSRIALAEGMGIAALRAVWGSDETHVFAVGDRGTIVAWDGEAWTREEANTDVPLAAIWGPGTDAVFVGGGEPGGEGVLLRRDGPVWRTVFNAPSALRAVIGYEFSDGRFFVSGERGYIGEFGGPADDYSFRRGGAPQTHLDLLGGVADPNSRRRLLVGADLDLSGLRDGFALSNYWWPSANVVRLGDAPRQ